MRWPFTMRSTAEKTLEIQNAAWSKTHQEAMDRLRRDHARVLEPAIDRIMRLNIRSTDRESGDYHACTSVTRRGMDILRDSGNRDRTMVAQGLGASLAYRIVKAAVEGKF